MKIRTLTSLEKSKLRKQGEIPSGQIQLERSSGAPGGGSCIPLMLTHTHTHAHTHWDPGPSWICTALSGPGNPQSSDWQEPGIPASPLAALAMGWGYTRIRNGLGDFGSSARVTRHLSFTA